MLAELEQALGRLDLIYLEHQGRRSGRTYTTELSFAVADGSVYLLARKHDDGRRPDWLGNMLAGERALFYAGTRALLAEPEVLDASWTPRIRELFRGRYGGATVRRWYEDDGEHIPVRLSSVVLADLKSGGDGANAGSSKISR